MGRPETLDMWLLGLLSQSLPANRYELISDLTPAEATALTLGWRLGQYTFSRYKQNKPGAIAELVTPEIADIDYIEATVEATWLARDLINTPANNMGPDDLEEAARKMSIPIVIATLFVVLLVVDLATAPTYQEPADLPSDS